jgi:hypothetical protein
MEGRGLAKGNLSQQNAFLTQSRADAPSALAQVCAQGANGHLRLRCEVPLH